MANFKRLLWELKTDFSSEKSSEKTFDFKEKLDTLISGSIAGAEPQRKRASFTYRSELRELSLWHRDQVILFNENHVRFRACKRILIADESREKLDSTVQRAYFGSTGIRYFIWDLQERAARLDPGSQDVSQMIIRCYNSCIHPMLDHHQRLEEKCRALEDQIDGAASMLSDNESLFRAIGYTSCKQQLDALKARLDAGSCENAAEQLQALRDVLDENEKALEEMLRKCDPMPKPAPLKNAPLRASLIEVLAPEHLAPLSSPENWTPETYAARIREFLAELEEKLLKNYLLSSEQPDNNEEER